MNRPTDFPHERLDPFRLIGSEVPAVVPHLVFGGSQSQDRGFDFLTVGGCEIGKVDGSRETACAREPRPQGLRVLPVCLVVGGVLDGVLVAAGRLPEATGVENRAVFVAVVVARAVTVVNAVEERVSCFADIPHDPVLVGQRIETSAAGKGREGGRWQMKEEVEIFGGIVWHGLPRYLCLPHISIAE